MLLLTNLSYLDDLKITFLEKEASKFKKEIFLNLKDVFQIYDIFKDSPKEFLKNNSVNFIQTNYLIEFEKEENLVKFIELLNFLKTVNIKNITIKMPTFSGNLCHKPYFKKLDKILKGFNVFIELDKDQTYLYLYNLIKDNKLKYKVLYKPEIVYDQVKSITSTYQYLKPYIGCIILDDKIEQKPVLLGNGKLKIFELLKKIISFNKKIIFIYENNFKEYINKHYYLNIAKSSEKKQCIQKIKNTIDPLNKLEKLTLDDITLYEILRLERII